MEQSGFFAKSQLQNYRERLPDFDAERTALQKEKELLSEEAANVHHENKTLRTTLEQKNKELRHLQDEIVRMREKESALRTIILNKAGNQKVSDKEVKDMFLFLRQRVQIISSSGAFDVNRPLRFNLDDRRQARFYDTKVWRNLSAGDRANRLKSHIFFKLHFHILDAKLFGMTGFGITGYDVGDRNKTYLVEPGFRRFESLLLDKKSEYLWKPNSMSRSGLSSRPRPVLYLCPLTESANNTKRLIVNSTMATEWRIQTIECIEQLGHQSQSASNAAEDIFEFFSPILSKGGGPRSEAELRTNLQELCETAYKLRMMMRKSKEGYRCVMPDIDDSNKNLLSEYEHLAEELGVEGGKNNEGSNEIAYFLSAALVKQRGDLTDDKPMVLEKGYVILKRK
jgi:uncharacterized protein (UPF0335 family)